MSDTSELLTTGRGPFVGSAVPVVVPEGWVDEERVVAGVAAAQRDDLPPAPFRTRAIVRRPSDPSTFSGTVVVEWHNVSGGVDASPDFTMLADELYRQGHAYVGVSAQYAGVMGGGAVVTVDAEGAGGIVGAGLRTIDLGRYGSLDHPGDAYAYDIFDQVGRATRAGLLGDLEPTTVLAVGESQSAFALTTFVNVVHPEGRTFDGFLIHSRGSGSAPLGEAGAGLDILSVFASEPATIRTDLDVPVLTVEMETDVSLLGFHRARQPDTERFSTWEVAGAAHADRFLVGAYADAVDCGAPINDGPQHFVVAAALRALDRWVATGEAPPSSARIEVDDTGSVQRDADGIALGGIRTPLVDVPTATLTGDPQAFHGLCFLAGATNPFTAEQLARYPDAAAYLKAYEAAADDAVAAGFVVPEDRDALLAMARPDLVDATG